MKNAYFTSFPIQQLKQKLLAKQGIQNNRIVINTAIFDRNVFVKEFARRVANGICQLCEENAPFLDKRGNPYLEIHHIHYLSKGGTDTIDNVVALCPNCHRKIHQLELDEDIRKLKEKAVLNSRM